jgi:hypothetical protein
MRKKKNVQNYSNYTRDFKYAIYFGELKRCKINKKLMTIWKTKPFSILCHPLIRIGSARDGFQPNLPIWSQYTRPC